MLIVELPDSPLKTPSGNEDRSILIVTSSSPSTTPSSAIGISNEAIVSPARNLTAYGPDE